jgi:flagellar biosynthesis protein FlhF
MISTDGYRIGAHKQLQTYGQILKVPVLIAAADRLKEILDGVSDKKLILIDTTGMSPRDSRLNDQISLLANHPFIKNHLVLSANTQRSALDEVIRAFSTLGLHGCILTKLDEAVSLGALLSEIIHHQLPLTYVCNGQRVPEDIHSARVNDLLTRTLSLSRRFEKTLAEAAHPQPLRTMEVKVNAQI